MSALLQFASTWLVSFVRPIHGKNPFDCIPKGNKQELIGLIAECNIRELRQRLDTSPESFIEVDPGVDVVLLIIQKAVQLRERKKIEGLASLVNALVVNHGVLLNAIHFEAAIYSNPVFTELLAYESVRSSFVDTMVTRCFSICIEHVLPKQLETIIHHTYDRPSLKDMWSRFSPELGKLFPVDAVIRYNSKEIFNIYLERADVRAAEPSTNSNILHKLAELKEGAEMVHMLASKRFGDFQWLRIQRNSFNCLPSDIALENGNQQVFSAIKTGNRQFTSQQPLVDLPDLGAQELHYNSSSYRTGDSCKAAFWGCLGVVGRALSTVFDFEADKGNLNLEELRDTYDPYDFDW